MMPISLLSHKVNKEMGMILSDVCQSYSQQFGHAGLTLIREMAKWHMQGFPAGKFQLNNAFLLMGMLVYNMLKPIGQDLVLAKPWA
mgnify:CR=1 FL=1